MAELPALPIGSVIEDRYEVLSELGLGSSGRVYKARQISTGQRVAVKTLRLGVEPDDSDHTARRRFEREMQLCAELSHPNIVRLLDSGHLPGGELFVVFEFVPGTTLDQLLIEVGALGFREALHLMAQVLDALACAHRHGIIHRDLKPANIMVSDTGARRNALVLDFGLGGFQDRAALRASQELTRTGEFMGTPLYAAPEQLRGEPATARSDLYAWSLVLLECLLGRHVLEGNARAGVVRFASGDPLPLPTWLRRHRLTRLLEVFTAPDPKDRDLSLESALRTLELAGWEGPDDARRSEGETTPSGEWRMLMIASCRICLVGPESGALDAERRDTLLRRELEVCAEIASKHGGQVASQAGARVLLQFGHPRAAEDDARRAAGAAREIVAAVAARNAKLSAERGPALEVHIGLHAGTVLTRDLPAGERGGIDAVGGTLATAIDLDELADPGEVLLSPEMCDALRDSSSVEIAPDRVLDARPSDPIHRLRARRGGAAREGAGETLLVARDRELHELRSAWERACSGAPTCVVISGEVGLGKSRLVRELRRASQGAAWIEGRCLPEHRDSPLRPIIELITATDESVESLVERCGLDARPNVALIRSLLGLPPHPDEPMGSMSRERQSDLTLAALVSLVTGMAQAEPAVFVVEDLHWADPTSIEFLTRLVREIQAAQLFEAERPLRLLVVLTARTEFVNPWSEATPILLRRLSRADVHKMIESGLSGDAPLPAALLEQIIQGADGTPLFVEEVTRMLLAARSPRRRLGKDPGAPIEIPTSLTSLLAARLDALSPDAKETAQVASVLGREFEYSLLEKVAPKDSTTLRHDLEELVQSALLLARGRSLERYVFKHALIRDAAYQSMIESVRSEWHRRTAAVLLRDSHEWSEQRPEVIAWHFEGAREPANAADYRRRSADRALVHAAYLEAIRHAEQGLELLEQVAPSRERTELSLRLTESLGSARFSTSGYSVPDVRNAFERALALCGELGGEIPIRVLWGLWMFQSTTGQDSGASEVIGHLRRRAEALGDPVSLLAAHTAIGALAYYHGDFERALAESRSALDYYSTVEFQAFVRDYGYDIGIYAFAHLTAALLALGYWAESSRVCSHMLAVAERWENPYIMAMARSHAMNMVRAFGDVDATSELVDQQIAQAQEQKLDLWIGPAICVRGWVIARRGDPVAGIAEMKRGLEQSERTGFLVCRGFFLGHLAEAQLAQGDVDAAIASLDRALELCKSSLDRFYEAVLLQLKGECLNAHGDTAGAENHFRRSLELGRKQRSKSYERLAVQSLARLLDERGEKEASAELLRPIVAWFRAGHQVPGLFDAEVFRESPRPSLQ